MGLLQRSRSSANRNWLRFETAVHPHVCGEQIKTLTAGDGRWKAVETGSEQSLGSQPLDGAKAKHMTKAGGP